MVIFVRLTLVNFPLIMILAEILRYLESVAPFSFQENYDNSGLLIGEKNEEVTGVLICLDVTEEVIDEAVEKGLNLIISHHPLIFSGVKRITGQDATGRMIMQAIRQRIAIVALHTNLDNLAYGVNEALSARLGIQNIRILKPLEGKLRKLVTFCPVSHAETVRTALFNAGAGHIGNYDSCSYNLSGTGTFRALEGANPFVGIPGEIHHESEIRIEVIFPDFKESGLISALLDSHPYEEVAYDIYPLTNKMMNAGAGMIGELNEPTEVLKYLEQVKSALSLGCIRHTAEEGRLIRKVAVCGGSGSFLITDAMAAGADIFLTGDIKYHDFFIPGNGMVLADIGHYESEQYTKELIFTLLNKKFPTFALQISKRSTSPIKYL